jgi:hypothetical protein
MVSLDAFGNNSAPPVLGDHLDSVKEGLQREFTDIRREFAPTLLDNAPEADVLNRLEQQVSEFNASTPVSFRNSVNEEITTLRARLQSLSNVTAAPVAIGDSTDRPDAVVRVTEAFDELEALVTEKGKEITSEDIERIFVRYGDSAERAVKQMFTNDLGANPQPLEIPALNLWLNIGDSEDIAERLPIEGNIKGIPFGVDEDGGAVLYLRNGRQVKLSHNGFDKGLFKSDWPRWHREKKLFLDRAEFDEAEEEKGDAADQVEAGYSPPEEIAGRQIRKNLETGKYQIRGSSGFHDPRPNWAYKGRGKFKDRTIIFSDTLDTYELGDSAGAGRQGRSADTLSAAREPDDEETKVHKKEVQRIRREKEMAKEKRELLAELKALENATPKPAVETVKVPGIEKWRDEGEAIDQAERERTLRKALKIRDFAVMGEAQKLNHAKRMNEISQKWRKFPLWKKVGISLGLLGAATVGTALMPAAAAAPLWAAVFGWRGFGAAMTGATMGGLAATYAHKRNYSESAVKKVGFWSGLGAGILTFLGGQKLAAILDTGVGGSTKASASSGTLEASDKAPNTPEPTQYI